jgi:hypothetical protein
VDPSSMAEPALQRAIACARRLLRLRTISFVAIGAIAVAGALLLAFAPVVGGGAMAIEAWLVCSAAAAGWLAWTLLPRRRARGESGLTVNVVAEPRLHEWVAQLARRIGVSAPDAIRVAPAAGVWIDQIDDEPTLVVGAGTLGWLTKDELSRTVALELAMLRVRDDDNVVGALRFAESVDADRLARCATPVVGRAVRAIGRRIAAQADDLREACVAWALDEAPTELMPTDDDVHEAELVADAWDLLDERWLEPARRHGLVLDSMADVHRRLLTACEEHELVERSYVRDTGPAAASLLSDPDGIDVELAGWAAAQLTAGEDGIVTWDEYAQRVAIPTWRQTAADAVTAAATASGRAQPATVDSLIKAVDSGLGTALGVAMADARQRALDPEAESTPPTEREVDTAISDALAHSVCLTLVESELATPALDVLWGVGLVDESGAKLDVDVHVRGFLAAGDISGLRWYLRGTGLDTSQPLPLDGLTVPESLPDGTGLVVWQGLRPYDIVVSDGNVLGFRHSLGAQLRGVLSRLTGSYEELVELDDELAAGLDPDDPVELPRAQLAVDLGLVTSAELHRAPRGSRWTLRLSTAADPIRVSGPGDGRVVSQLLEPLLGDRLQHTGLSLRPNWFAVAIGKVSWYTIWGGILVLLAGAVGLLEVLQAPAEQTTGTQALDVAMTFGVFGAALIAIGLVPYRFIARRGHEPGLR